MKFQIFCDYLITGKSSQVEKDKILYVQDGKFIDIQSKNSSIKQKPDFQIIRLKNHLVCPGFINTHTHLSMSLFRGIGEGLPLKKWLSEVIQPLEQKFVNEDFVKLGVKLSAVELIRFGVTTVFDMYFHSIATAQILDQAGLRGILGEGLQRVWKSEIQNFLKEFSGHQRLKVALAPSSPHACSLEYLMEVLDFQKKYNLSLAIHVSETENEVRNIHQKYGQTPIAYLHDLGIQGEKTLYVHCVHATDEDLMIMSQSKTALSHNPESNMKLGSGVAPVSQAVDYGVCVGLGTDGQASNNNVNMLGEMQTCALLSSLQKKYRPLNISEILNMVFLGGAKAVGLEDQIGSIEIGKRADFIGINLNQAHFYPYYDLASHLVYSATGSEVRFVMCEGKILMSDGEIKTLDEEKIYWEVEQMKKNIDL